jgi:hypothetical protein
MMIDISAAMNSKAARIFGGLPSFAMCRALECMREDLGLSVPWIAL